ncbi:MAG TPA: hypothetical protein VGB43_01390 [Flavobacterium sp.]
MKKRIFTALLFVFAMQLTVAQKDKDMVDATITLTDGTTKTGKLKMPLDMSSSSYKLKNNGQTEKIENENIEKLTCTDGGFTYNYYNMAFDDGGGVKKKKRLMMLSIPVGKVKMYSYAWGASNFRPVYNMQALNTAGVSQYCKRDNEDFVTLISLDDGNSVNRNSIFKNRAMKYFADNAALVEKIKNKEYKFTDVYKVVMEYNGQITD